MKLNLLLKKRQLILAGLVIVLGIAVYLNWEFSDKDLISNNDDKVYGETQATNVEVTETSEDEQKKEITQKATQLAELTDCETAIEELIKAKGFRDCVAFIDGENASIVVSSDGLTQKEAAQIFEIVVKKAKINSENINIVESK